MLRRPCPLRLLLLPNRAEISQRSVVLEKTAEAADTAPNQGRSSFTDGCIRAIPAACLEPVARTMSEPDLMNLTRRMIDSFGSAWTKPPSLSEASDLPWWIVLANRMELAKRRIQSSVDLGFHTR